MERLSTGTRMLFSLAALVLAALGSTAAAEQSNSISESIRAGRLSEARAALEQALKTSPAQPELWNLLGVVQAQQNRPKQAEESFRRAVELSPKFLPAWLNLGRLYQGSSDVDKAVSAYESVLRLDPANAEAHHQLALVLETKGEFRASLAHLDRLPAGDRDRVGALALRCAAEAALGNEPQAIAAADRMLKDSRLEEDDAVAILPVVQKHNKAVALHLLEGLDRKHLAVESLPQLAAAYEDAGDLKRARETYERVAQTRGVSPPVLLDLARVAWKQKDYEGTLGYLAHARELDPNNAGIHFFFGLACNELKVPVEAKKSLEKALELAPDNPYYDYAMGAVLLQWSDKSQAIPYLKKFIQLRPADARGRLALATAYFETLQQDEAKTELAVALKDAATRPGAEYLLGRILIQQDDLPGAVAAFRRLTELQPQSAEAHAELASVLLDKGEPEASRREVEAALKLDPESYVANRTLMKLYQAAGDQRFKDQAALLKKLIQKNDERAKLLQRTIEVRPW